MDKKIKKIKIIYVKKKFDLLIDNFKLKKKFDLLIDNLKLILMYITTLLFCFQNR